MSTDISTVRENAVAVRSNGQSPAMLAEQQRAKSEIEAALTIAASRPRDQQAAIDRIVVACQRPGVAENALYSYARGGTSIDGVSIRLLEVIAQNWGNVEWGFRELARYHGGDGEPGQSIVEAVAWDLETNSRVRRQFTVEHAMKAHGKTKFLTDPRDIYEWIANNAQRRVRTCLENIIPIDVLETAREECNKTNRAEIKDPVKASADMAKAFAAIGVSREMIEARIQRRLAAITPAQIIGLRKIYASLRDGISDVADWFTAETDETPRADVKPQQSKSESLADRLGQDPNDDTPGLEPDEATDIDTPGSGEVRDGYMAMVDQIDSADQCNACIDDVKADVLLSAAHRATVLDALRKQLAKLRK